MRLIDNFKNFFSGRPLTVWEPNDRTPREVSRDLTPEKVDAIMQRANHGDVADQCRLSQEILEKNHTIIEAVGTRIDAVLGCDWRVVAGGDSPTDKEAAERLETELLSCGFHDDTDNFRDLLRGLMGALLPGFAVSEILWRDGGAIGGFREIPPDHFTFSGSRMPLLITREYPRGIALPRRRIIYHRSRIHGSDPVRGGLIRPLAWLHCFSNLDIKYLLAFVERYGMPFVAAKVSRETYEKERNVLRRLIRNFGSSGGGLFSHDVELQLLESASVGEAYFRLLEYVDNAIRRVIVGQIATSSEASGWSQGGAQAAVRQDILSADCSWLEDSVNTQLFLLWNHFNYGNRAKAPRLTIDCEPPEDKSAAAEMLLKLSSAGFIADPVEVSEKMGMKFTLRPPEMHNPRGGSYLLSDAPMIGSAFSNDPNPVNPPSFPRGDHDRLRRNVGRWLAPMGDEVERILDIEDPTKFAAALRKLSSEGAFGSSKGFEQQLEELIDDDLA